MINNFNEFISSVKSSGFSMGGAQNDGIYSFFSECSPAVKWHTEDPETDPWEWRIRTVSERSDIAYAKLFFNKSGYITDEYYPYFLSCRRRAKNGGIKSLEAEYSMGKISRAERTVYGIIEQKGAVSVHAIKYYGGFTKENSAEFEKALTSLQMKMFITVCGAQQKLGSSGELYGWKSTVFCLTEAFMGFDIFEKAERTTPEYAEDRIISQIYRLNPDCDAAKIEKFIYGGKKPL